MAKEPDQTKWVGIRPTNPSENIPVTESAPLSSIEVEPAAGCGNFPVTESAPLTSIEVEPAAGCGNFPVTESAPLTSIEVEPKAGCGNFPVTESVPLTDILVGPKAGSPEFLTLTKKKTPAISDLQAIEDVQRYVIQGAAGGVGAVNRDSTACPAGKIWIIQAIFSVNASAGCSGIQHTIRTAGGTSYFIDFILNPVAGQPLITSGNYVLEPGDFIRSGFTGIPAAADWLQFSVVGFLTDIY